MTATVAGWITYAAARGDTVADNADSAAALQRAMDYIAYHYVARLRAGIDPDTLAVVDPATYEAAKLELATPGFWTKTYTASEKKVLTEVKGIKWMLVGGSDAMGWEGSTPVSSLIEAMFAPYIIDDRDPQAFIRSIGSAV